MDIFLKWGIFLVVAAHTRETSETYCVSKCTERVLLFCARDANLRIVNITIDIVAIISMILHAVQGSTMEPERGDSKNERLRKQKTVTPHRPAKRTRLFQADQQETELRQRRTFRKWRHNLAVYYAASLHGSCVNSASLLRRWANSFLVIVRDAFCLVDSFTADDYHGCRHLHPTSKFNNKRIKNIRRCFRGEKRF